MGGKKKLGDDLFSECTDGDWSRLMAGGRTAAFRLAEKTGESARETVSKVEAALEHMRERGTMTMLPADGGRPTIHMWQPTSASSTAVPTRRFNSPGFMVNFLTTTATKLLNVRFSPSSSLFFGALKKAPALLWGPRARVSARPQGPPTPPPSPR